jgi:predicted TIM-barrel fold metal-dependent hydrolase
MVATLHKDPAASPATDNVVLVSSDCHIGPLLEQLREYVPQKYLGDFDVYAKEQREAAAAIAEGMGAAMAAGGAIPEQIRAQLEANPEMAKMLRSGAQMARNRQTAGHHDIHTRLRDMNRDGLTSEVIFHGSQNGEPIPFVAGHQPTAGLTTPFTFEGVDHELAYVGLHAYNQWLAEACSVEPERHVGLCYIPAWDPEQAADEAAWGAEHGLRGVNFPAWRPGMPVLQDDVWERFYSVVNEANLPLTNHGGAGDDNVWPEREAVALRFMESAYHSKRLIWTLGFHGVFEQYPNIKLVISEIPGDWWPALMKEMDSVFVQGALSGGRRPSQWAAEHVFHGATFLSKDEAIDAVEHDYWRNVCWGSDYPHIEGTWMYDENEDVEPITHLALRDTFAGLPTEAIRGMAGINLAQVYGLPLDKLQDVANRIAAPSMDEIVTPLDDADIPEDHGMFAFRRIGAWA